MIYCGDVLTLAALSCCCFPTTWQHDLWRGQLNNYGAAPRNYYETRLGHSATVRFKLCALPADSGYESPRLFDLSWLARKGVSRRVGRFARFVHSVLGTGGGSDNCLCVVDPPSTCHGCSSRRTGCGGWHSRSDRVDSHPTACQRNQQIEYRSVCRLRIPVGGGGPRLTHSHTAPQRGNRGGSTPGEAEMSVVLLYLLLTKATITSFSGLASLPVLRQDLIVNRHLLTDAQLDTAVVVSRTTPGPIGVYVVSVGYYADGIPGAVAEWLAMITPAFLIILLLRLFGRSVDHPRVRSLQQAVVFASAGLLVAASLPLARDAVTGIVTAVIVIASILFMVLRKADALWIVVGAAVVNFLAAVAHIRSLSSVRLSGGSSRVG